MKDGIYMSRDIKGVAVEAAVWNVAERERMNGKKSVVTEPDVIAAKSKTI